MQIFLTVPFRDSVRSCPNSRFDLFKYFGSTNDKRDGIKRGNEEIMSINATDRITSKKWFNFCTAKNGLEDEIQGKHSTRTLKGVGIGNFG